MHAEQLDTRPASEREAESTRLLEFYHRHVVDAGTVLAPARPWRASLFPQLSPGRTFHDVAEARDWLRLERPNLLAAVEYFADTGEFDRVVQWCVLLWPFYEKEKYLDDLFATHKLGLTAAWRLSRTEVGSLLHSQVGFAHYWRRDLDAAATAFGNAVRQAREAGSVPLEATAAEGFGLVEFARGDVVRALDLLRHNLELATTIGDERRVALAKLHLAKAEEPDTALPLLAEADEVFVRLLADEAENRAKIATWRGRKLVELQDWTRAREALLPALETMTARGRRFDQAEVLVALGDLSAGLDERDAAVAYYREALVCYEDLGFSALAAAVRDKINGMG